MAIYVLKRRLDCLIGFGKREERLMAKTTKNVLLSKANSGLNFCLLDCRLGPASIVVATAGVLIHGRTLPRQSVLLPVC